MLNERIEALSAYLSGTEAFLITSEPSRQYVTGFKSSAGTVAVTCDGAYLFIDSRYHEKAAATVKHCEVILQKNLTEQLKTLLNDKSITTVYTESSRISIDEFFGLREKLSPIEVVDDSKMDKILSELRSVKDRREVDFIRYSQQLTEKTFEHILGFIAAGKTERETALEMEFFMRRLGSEGVAFDFIVVSGKNSSLPHGVPTDKPFEKGDFITMDFGAVFEGYCSDMTRTVAVGAVSEEQQRVYNTVLLAQLKGIETIRAGITGAEADKAARDVINAAGYGDYFGHSLGHSVGLEIHESPNCSPKSQSVLKAGNIMTVEPGVYIPEKFGVRIEDMVLITETGCENLTKSPKELIIL